jgi:hypothetical protein
MHRRTQPLTLGCALAALLIAVLAGTALAAPPGNDNFAGATAITSFPFQDTVDITEGSTEPGEPCACYCSSRTVWYSLTVSADTVLTVSATGATNQGNVNVYQEYGPGLCCLLWTAGSLCGSPVFVAKAGQTFVLQAGPTSDSSGNLTVHVEVPPPPANDNFADATLVSALPFSFQGDLNGATTEPGEPSFSCTPPQGTVWFAFTPAASGSYTVNVSTSSASTAVEVYTGTSLGNLAELACRFSGPAVFHADAGTTYYLRVGGGYGLPGSMVISLGVAPPPSTSFSWSPTDPSSADTVQFSPYKYDPAGGEFGPDHWSFGDGTTGTGGTHKYAADRDYTVTLVSTTLDGRSATATQVIHVRTHDVGIAKLTVPQSARSGQTRQISVGITNARYPETVEVDLYRSTPFGDQPVGSLIQTIPVRTTNRTTPFDFSYTFTAADAAVGSVTFRAVVGIQLAHDAFPADNQVSALPTKVSK